MASILLAKGEAPQAETAVQALLKELSKDDADSGGQARLLLVRALLDQGKSLEALKEMVVLNAMVKPSSPRSLRYGALIASARVQAATGRQPNIAPSVDSLQKIAREAKRAGMRGFELEARLALGEIELADGKASAARKDLEEVQREALANGYRLIEQRAARAAGH